jgi:hypothetical protein
MLCGQAWTAGHVNRGDAACIYPHLEPMPADGKQSVHTCRISFGLPPIKSRGCRVPQKVARSAKTDGPYESRAETEAAVERIHGHFKDVKAAITKEKAAKISAPDDSDRRQLQSALDRQVLQLALGALTEARYSLTKAHKVVRTSIDIVKRAIERNRSA